MVKRTFDIICGAASILLLGPVLLILSAVVKFGSPGPILYCGRRSGRHGKVFHIYKFRSMVTDAEQIGGPSTSDDDPRITGVGHFTRKFKLDELPQLLNVLRGEMSLVGPRPQVPDYVSHYSDDELQVLEVRPGITDWASIWNSDEGAVLAGQPDPDKAYNELIHPTKMRLQLLYVKDHSFWVDFKILAYTFYGLIQRGWIPEELRAYAKPGESNIAEAPSFETVTELPGAPVHTEQIQMLDTRYGWAGDLVEGKEVLEVACGSGIGLGHLATRAKSVVAGDYDPKLTEIASNQYGESLEIRQMDAEALPFENASFDVVLLFEAIYYLPNPEQFIEEAHRILRPGGALLICSANCERADFNASPFSLRYYGAKDLHQLMSSGGFQTKIYAGFPIEPKGWGGHVRQTCRYAAVKLRLIPKTMKWKALFKRIFFGKLQSLPPTLHQPLLARQPLTEIDPHQPATKYQVLYAIGTREAVAACVAA